MGEAHVADVAGIVLAAGAGTRLGELTRTTPKPMLPVGGRPLLDYALANLARAGVREVGVNLMHQSDVIRRYAATQPHGLELQLVEERELSGTAGALRLFEPLIRRHRTTLVLYGDILTTMDLRLLVEAHHRLGGVATVVVHRSESSNSVLQVDHSGVVTSFLERPEHRERLGTAWANSGLQAVAPSVMAVVPPHGAADLPRDVYGPLVAQRALRATPLTGYRCAIDSAARYLAAQEAVAHHAFP